MSKDQQKILLVDDEAKVRTLFSKFLTNQGFSAQTASDGKMAIVQAEKYKPDCILLDVMMPHGGMELLACLRKKNPDSIIIMMSAIIELNQVDDYLKNGAYACIEKPVIFNELLQRIKQALNV